MTDLQDLQALAGMSMFNRNALLDERDRSNKASCYHCADVFPIEEINHWTDDNTTAFCPKCGIDSVVPGVVPALTLKQARLYWFNLC